MAFHKVDDRFMGGGDRPSEALQNLFALVLLARQPGTTPQYSRLSFQLLLDLA
jgi:hypothetical protein